MSKLKNKAILFNDFDRSAQWFAPVFSEARKWNVDPFIVLAMIDQESAGKPDAIGDGGTSYGLLQIKQGALTDVINIQGLPFIKHSDLFDAETNIQYGAAYFALQLKRVGGNNYDALRAYNQGFGGMNRTDKGQLAKGKSYAKDVITKSSVFKNEFNIF